MNEGFITFDDGVISLGGVRLDGTLKSMSIRGQVRFDETKKEGDPMSGKAKTPMGWEDSDLVITVELLTVQEDTCYQKLDRLNAVFKGVEGDANPKIYSIANRHAQARGVNLVVFAGLETQETDQEDIVVASMNFVEHIPVVRAIEKGVVAGGKVAAGSTITPKSGVAVNPPVSKTILVSVE